MTGGDGREEETEERWEGSISHESSIRKGEVGRKGSHLSLHPVFENPGYPAVQFHVFCTNIKVVTILFFYAM